MNKFFIVVAFASLLSAAAGLGVAPCPIQSNVGSLISGTLLVTQRASPSPSSRAW